MLAMSIPDRKHADDFHASLVSAVRGKKSLTALYRDVSVIKG